MNIFKKYLSTFYKNIDLVFLFYYIVRIHWLVIERNYPAVNSSSVLNSIEIFVLTGLATLALTFSVFKNKIDQAAEKIAIFEKSNFPLFLNWLALISGVVVLISIAIGGYQFKEILSTESFALRAISTSLHPLVPLESRWIFLIGPWIFLLPAVDDKTKKLKLVNTLILVALIFLTQTKLNFLFLIVSCLMLLTQALFNNFSWPKVALYTSLFALSIFGLNSLLFRAEHGFHTTLQNRKVSGTLVKNESPLTAPTPDCYAFDPKTRQPINPADYEKASHSSEFSPVMIAANIENRIFNTSSKVSNVFYCLRDTGHWSPNFKGHQLAKVFGLHIPVYRWAMEYVDPNYGATAATSAVANFVSDAYLNLGLKGVFLATLIAFLGWSFLKLLSSGNSTLEMYFYYLRLLYVFILTSQSFISAFVIVLFLVIVAALFKLFDYFLRTRNETAVLQSS